MGDHLAGSDDQRRGPAEPAAFVVGGERDNNTTIIAVARDGGRTWTNTTDRLPGAPDSAYIPSIKASVHAPGRAYAVVDAHRQTDLNAHAYKTEAYGERWERVPIPAEVGLHEIVEDPVQPNLLFAAAAVEAGVAGATSRSTTAPARAAGRRRGPRSRPAAIPLPYGSAAGRPPRPWTCSPIRARIPSSSTRPSNR